MRAKAVIVLLPLLLGACTYEDATDEKKPAETPAQAQATDNITDWSVPEGEPEYDATALEQGRMAHFSPGVIDGEWGKNTQKAVCWFQFAQGINPTGQVDKGTLDALVRAAGAGDTLTRVSVTPDDVKGPFTEVPKDPYEQEKLECLCYASALELFAERGHASPELIQKLNPKVDFANLAPGTELVLPNVPQSGEVKSQSDVKPAQGPAAAGQVSQILISKQGFYLQGLDAQGHILYHFPSSRRLICRRAPIRPWAWSGCRSRSRTTESTARPRRRRSATPPATAASA